MIKKILHPILILALFLTLFGQTALAKSPQESAGNLKKLFKNTGGLSSVGKDEVEKALDGEDLAVVKESYKVEYGEDLDAVAKDKMSENAMSSYQEKSKGAEIPMGEAEQNEVKPAVIPCTKNLPCIQPGTQSHGGGAIREYILGTFGVKFLTGFWGLVAATSVIFIIIGGLQMHLAFGNDEAVGTAKKTLTWAIVGLVIAILSVGIVRIISSINL